MRIIGFNLSKISIQRKEILEDNLHATQNIDIKDIISLKLPVSEEDALKITFNFKIEYSKEAANLDFLGYVFVQAKKEERDKILKSWKKEEKEIPEEIRMSLFNFIMNKCNIKAISLEDEMNLPLHIPMPQIASKPSEE